MGRSEQLGHDTHDTDKIPGGYLRYYDREFAGREKSTRVLVELGIDKGGSLRLWHDWFPWARIIGFDRCAHPPMHGQWPRIETHLCQQSDPATILRHLPPVVDIIIDDMSHLRSLTEPCLWALWDRLAPGGLYVIEDWCTGYCEDWPDGEQTADMPRTPAGHSAGMVGLVKTLVDEVGAAVASRGKLTGPVLRKSRFSRMAVYAGLVCIEKA